MAVRRRHHPGDWPGAAKPRRPGGGTIATEYAFIFRALGAEVTLVMREDAVMAGCGMDSSIQSAVMDRMRRVGIEVKPDSGIFSEVNPGPEGR